MLDRGHTGGLPAFQRVLSFRGNDIHRSALGDCPNKGGRIQFRPGRCPHPADYRQRSSPTPEGPVDANVTGNRPRSSLIAELIRHGPQFHFRTPGPSLAFQLAGAWTLVSVRHLLPLRLTCRLSVVPRWLLAPSGFKADTTILDCLSTL